MAPTDATTHFTIVATRGTDCDLIAGGWGQDFPSGSTVLGVIMKGGAAITPTGNGNLSYFDNAEVNAELDRIAALTDAGEAGRAYAALDKKIMTDYAPLIPSYYDHWFSMVGSRVGGAAAARKGVSEAEIIRQGIHLAALASRDWREPFFEDTVGLGGPVTREEIRGAVAGRPQRGAKGRGKAA